MEADVAVVGAGSAGCVIAARLSETRRVVLLEAGPDYPDPASLPRDLADGSRNSLRTHDWGYVHTPRAGQWMKYILPRGRVVGGSSAVNTCIALRGVPEDYDEWGLAEWTFAACLPAFKRIERDLDFGHVTEWHGNSGPLPIRRHAPEELVPWQAAFMEACAERGLPFAVDHNDPTRTGVAPHPQNKVGGRRISAAEAWLTPAVRARISIAAGALVRRVLFDRARVTGVELADGRIVHAPQVVLAAGALNTPGVLLRSGVGPAAELARLGVPRVADVPAVGARLLDHPGTAIFLRPKRGVIVPGAPVIQVGLRYRSKDGPVPNDMILQPGSVFALPWFDVPLVSLMSPIGKPRGFGRMVWPSADPRARPIIESRFFSDPADLARGVEAMELARDLASTRAIGGIAKLFLPGPRADLRAWVRARCDSGYHPCGTVPMGPGGACDARGRVNGVEGLVVADASLFPTIPSANIHLSVLMAGERIGGWLAEEPVRS